MQKRVNFGDRCRDKLVVLTILAALHSIGRVNTKVYTHTYSDTVEDIKEWMSDPLKRKGDLVVSMGLVKGFEQAIIMDLTGGDAEVATRTLANVIRVISNHVLDQQWAIQNILKPGHDCSTIMDWTSTRAKIPSDISPMMGEISFHTPYFNMFFIKQNGHLHMDRG